MAQQVAYRVIGELHVDAVDGEQQVPFILAEARLGGEGLHMGDVAAEVAHHAEGVGEEGFHVGIGLIEAGRLVRAIGFLPAVEAHFEEQVDQLAAPGRRPYTAGRARRSG